jgi:hypothetical protein
LYLAAIAGGSTEGAFERSELEPKEPADNVAVPDVGVEEVDRFHCSLDLWELEFWTESHVNVLISKVLAFNMHFRC